MEPGSTYEDAGRYVIDKFVLVHVADWPGKFEMLLIMFKKLRLLRAGKIAVSALRNLTMPCLNVAQSVAGLCPYSTKNA